LVEASRSKMPPQQLKRLLDLLGERGDFGTHGAAAPELADFGWARLKPPRAAEVKSIEAAERGVVRRLEA
jgi:hypothetical protein